MKTIATGSIRRYNEASTKQGENWDRVLRSQDTAKRVDPNHYQNVYQFGVTYCSITRNRKSMIPNRCHLLTQSI